MAKAEVVTVVEMHNNGIGGDSGEGGSGVSDGGKGGVGHGGNSDGKIEGDGGGS